MGQYLENLRGSGMVTPGGGLILWQSLWRDGVTIRWWWWWGGREWWCLERDPQGKEHCQPCCPQVLWTMGSTEVRAPPSESQCRAPIRPSRKGLAGGLQWPRDPNVSCVRHEPYKSRVSALGSQSRPILGQKQCSCSGSHPVTRWPFWNWG